MTLRRWATTSLAMALIGAGLLVLAPDGELVRAAIDGPQTLVDTRGPDALLVLLTWVLAGLCWAWGALGLLLTGLSTLPGVPGRLAGLAVLVLLPAGLRRAAAVAVGVSLVAGPVLASHSSVPATPVLAVAGSDTSRVPTDHRIADHRTADHRTADDGTAHHGTADHPAAAQPSARGSPLPTGPAPDWPVAPPASPTDTPPAPTPPPVPPAAPVPPVQAAPGSESASDVGPVPDWPDPAPAGAHVVVRGDVLWDLAERWLTERLPTQGGTVAPPGAPAIAAAVHAWWQANADVIGPDPDLLLPGQVLVPPAP